MNLEKTVIRLASRFVLLMNAAPRPNPKIAVTGQRGLARGGVSGRIWLRRSGGWFEGDLVAEGFQL